MTGSITPVAAAAIIHTDIIKQLLQAERMYDIIVELWMRDRQPLKTVDLVAMAGDRAEDTARPSLPGGFQTALFVLDNVSVHAGIWDFEIPEIPQHVLLGKK